MKHGKRLSRDQKQLLAKWGLNPADWLAVKNTSEELVIVHRHSDKTMRTIPKEGRT